MGDPLSVASSRGKLSGRWSYQEDEVSVFSYGQSDRAGGNKHRLQQGRFQFFKELTQLLVWVSCRLDAEHLLQCWPEQSRKLLRASWKWCSPVVYLLKCILVALWTSVSYSVLRRRVWQKWSRWEYYAVSAQLAVKTCWKCRGANNLLHFPFFV